MKRFGLLVIVLVGLLLAGCRPGSLSFSGPDPEPRDITSPNGLAPELAAMRIPWRGEGSVDQRGVTIRLDGTGILVPPKGCGNPSPSGKYLVCVSGIGSSIELLDLESGSRRVLVSKERDFPEAMDLSFPRFTPDEKAIAFTVGWEDSTDPALVDLETGEIELIDAPGIFNSDPVVSPDGRWLLVSCEGQKPGAGFVLCIIDREDGRRTYLVDEAVNIHYTGIFADDGRTIVYTANYGGLNGEARLYKIDLENRESHLLVSGLHPTDGVLGVNSSSIAFTCTFPERPACSWVCVVDLEGKEVQRLTYLGESCIDLDAP